MVAGILRDTQLDNIGDWTFSWRRKTKPFFGIICFLLADMVRQACHYHLTLKTLRSVKSRRKNGIKSNALFCTSHRLSRGRNSTEPQKKKAEEAIWPIPVKLQQEITQRFRTNILGCNWVISVHTHLITDLRIQPSVFRHD